MLRYSFIFNRILDLVSFNSFLPWQISGDNWYEKALNAKDVMNTKDFQ